VDDKKDGKRTTSGDAPAYVEIESAEVSGTQDGLDMTVVLSGPPPRRITASDTALRVSFILAMDGGGRYSFNAQPMRSGWRAFGSGGNEASIPTEVSVQRAEIRMRASWVDVGGPRPFGWLVSVSWTRDRAGSTSYAFDSLPVTGFARYPD
jgi:hypothetical protein